MARIVYLILIIWSVASACISESLVIYDSLVISETNADFSFKTTNNIEINGICISDTITLVASSQGIIVKFPNDQNWRQLVTCEEYADNWHDNITRAEQENALYRPKNIWEASRAGEFMVFDDRCERFYSLDITESLNEQFHILKRPHEKSMIENIDVSRHLILCGLYPLNHKHQVGVLKPDFSGYRSIFDIPRQVRHNLDSMGAEYYPSPVFNLVNSTIWVAFRHYNRIYIIDLDGRIQDSVRIDDPRFVVPQPPASRIKSPAVHDDWYSKCSSVYSLQYVAPGYLFLQFYGTGLRTDGGSRRSVYSLLWTAEGESVEFEINPRWKTVDIQSGRCLPFVTYNYEDSVFKCATVYLTRIEP